MNIQVRIATAQARAEVKALQARIAQLEAQLAMGRKSGMQFSQGIGGGLASLEKLGSRTQWAGRQLSRNFTLPLALAGAASLKFQLDNQRAITSVSKVYGDLGMSMTQRTSEVNALSRAFVALSNQYGVQQKDVIGIAAAWAAAGSSGVALAKATELTLRTMVLGEIDANKATLALIAIQAQYRFSTDQLSKTIDTLNIIENQTGISMAGLIEGFSRSAGAAANAGIDVRHLGAMLAAIVPAAGSAAQGGNALKTIISRLLAPTKQASGILKGMGVNTEDFGWKSLNASQRLEILAKKFVGLKDSQKANVSATLASRYQINKFDVLMQDIASHTGYYQKALNAAGNEQANFNQAQRELNQVLSSQPQQLKQVGVILQNSLAKIVTPLIPTIIMLATMIERAVTWFSQLPLPIQKAAGLFILFVAALGPVLTYLGSLETLIGFVGRGLLLSGAAAFRAAAGFAALAGIAWNAIMAGLGAILAFGMRGGAIILAGLGRAAMVAVAGLATLGRVVLPFIIGFGRVLTAGFLLIGRNIAVIWSGTMTAIAALTRAGMTITAAVWTVGWRAISATAAMLFVNLGATFARGFAMLAAGFRAGMVALAVISAAWFRAIPAIFAAGMASLRVLAVVNLARLAAAVRVGMTAVTVALTGPVGWAIAAVAALFVIFHKQIIQVFQNILGAFQNTTTGIGAMFAPVVRLFQAAVGFIQKAFNALPAGVQGAMQAVVNIVYQAAMAVYRLFSYLNPFAHHSPSLVENVTNGMSVILAQFARLQDVSKPIGKAYKDIKAFGIAIASFMKGMDSVKRAQDLSKVAKFAPGAVGEFKALSADLVVLKTRLDALSGAINGQQQVVDKWKVKLDAANNSLDVQQQKLDTLQKIADGYSQQLDVAQTALDKFASAPIQGMKAMGDQIFANTMAQKALQLQMLQMDQAAGGIDNLQNKLQALGGEIETLRGQQASLQQAGAGSDILAGYDNQIAALQAQQGEIQGTASAYNDLQKQLDALDKAGQILDLQNSLQFDPLKKQIEDVATAMHELPFDQILAGVTANKALVDQLTAAYDHANDAVKQQQHVVDALTGARDAIQASYDVENKKLQGLQDAYGKVNDAIQAINTSLNDLMSAADAAAQKLSSVKGGGGAGGGGGLGTGANFPGVGGTGKIGREGIAGDQAKMIDDFTKSLANQTGQMLAKFDIFKPLRDNWNKFTGWFSKNVKPTLAPARDAFGHIFDGVNFGNPLSGLDFGWVMKLGKQIVGALKDVWTWAGDIVNLFKGDFIKYFQQIWENVSKHIQPLIAELKGFGPVLGNLGKAFHNVWAFVKPVVEILGVTLLAVLKIAASVLANTIGPVINTILGVLTNFVQIFKGIVQVIVGILSGDWSMAWTGALNIVKGVFGAIGNVLQGAVQIIWGIVKGFVLGVVGFFQWLYDVLVGHSLIPDLVNAIIKWIASIPGKALAALADLGSKLLTLARAAMNSLWDGLKGVWNTVSSWLAGTATRTVIAIGNLGSTLYQKGKDVVQGLWDGIQKIWATVFNFFNGLGGRIVGVIGNLSGLLYNIGKSIFEGLLSGMNKGWEAVKGFVGGLGGWIASHKGPESYDLRLLQPNGNWIMQGLNTGLLQGLKPVIDTVSSIGPSIQQALTSANVTIPNNLKSAVTATAWDAATGATARMAATTTTATATQAASSAAYTELHFHGDMAFPNIQTGEDAQAFIQELEVLAGKGN